MRSTAGPPENVLPYTTVAFGCESAGAKTGVIGRLIYHVHANDTAVGLPGGPIQPVRVAVSWATPFFGKPKCTSEVLVAPTLGRAAAQGDDNRRSSIGRGGSRTFVVDRTATNADQNEVTFVLRLQQSLRSTGDLFSIGSLRSPANDTDLSRDEVSAALRTMDALEL